MTANKSGNVALLERGPASAAPVRTRRRRARGSSVPVLAGEPRVNWTPPRVRPAIVGGCDPVGGIPPGGLCPLGQASRWTFVGRDGGGTGLLGQARLFPFSAIGDRAAGAAAKRLLTKECPEARAFVLRVVVTGDWDRPQEIVEAWRLEGEPAPRNKRDCLPW